MNIFTNLWAKFSPNQQNWIVSYVHTFVTTFLLVICDTLRTGAVQWTRAFWLAVASTAVMTAVKAAGQASPFPLLGGQKKV